MHPILGFLITFPLFMVCVTIHEVSHGLVAYYFGDPTAKQAGRLSLNPLKHIDRFGTVILPLFLLLIKAPFLFGWAKPVPVDPRYFKSPKTQMLWVGLAGPASNFVMAILLAGVVNAFGSVMPEWFQGILVYLVILNLVLGLFNLIPVPPLDGSRVLAGLLPMSLAKHVYALERWGMVILIGLLYFGVLDRFVWPLVQRCLQWLL